MSLKPFTFVLQKPTFLESLFITRYYRITYKNKPYIKNVRGEDVEASLIALNKAFELGYRHALRVEVHKDCKKKQYVKSSASTTQL
jgi:hypothetical protein